MGGPQIALFLLCVLVNNSDVTVSLMLDDALDVPDVPDAPDAPQHELNSIKKTMIQGLGFTKVPDVTKMNVSQEEYSRMYDVYLSRLERRQLEEEDSMSENVPKFYTFHQKERRKRRRGVTRLTFNITSERHMSVQHSSLRLLAASGEQNGPVRVQVYQVLEGAPGRRLVDERDVHLAVGAPKWCELDVTTAVRNWMEYGEPNLGLELQCIECRRRGKPLLHEHDHGRTSPVINALLVSEGSRDKRSAEQMLFYEKNRRTDCHNRNSKRCCRHKMDFDLAQLGLDFIIQPKKFDGGICKGRCPPHYNAAHNHAVIQSLMWKKNKNLTPRLCCAPSKLNHLEILTVDEDNPEKLTVRKWENMIVLECACS